MISLWISTYFKELTLRRPSEEVTENGVLRDLPGLSSRRATGGMIVAEPEQAKGNWVTKGVSFPAGTEFRAHYKGQTYLARDFSLETLEKVLRLGELLADWKWLHN